MKRIITKTWEIWLMLAVLANILWPGATASAAVLQTPVNKANRYLTAGGSISGTVYKTNGITPGITPSYGATLVLAFFVPTNEPVPTISPTATSIPTPTIIPDQFTNTALDGSYTISGLISGNYIVCALYFSPYDHFPSSCIEYYEGVSSKDEATLVSVIAPNDTPGIDFTLKVEDYNLPGAPKITSIVPNNGLPGTTLTGVLINGANFTGVTSVIFDAPWVTASDLIVNEAGTQITTNVTISDNAFSGYRDIMVTTALGKGVLYSCFKVGPPPPPKVTSVIPNNGLPGTILTGVLINGTNFTGATAVTFSGTDVIASGLVVNGAGTQITANVTINDNAAFGARRVTVTTPDSASLPLVDGFSVVSPLPPTIISFSPDSEVQGTTLQGVSITGTNLTGVTAINFSGTGVTASGLRSAGSTYTLTVTIDGSAAVGPRNVTVTTPAGTSTPLVNGFTVMAATGLPTVSIGTPATVPAGGTFDVDVNVDRVTNINGWQFDLEYDNAVVQVNSVEGGNGVIPGLVGTTITPVDMWAFKPPLAPSGMIRVIGHFSSLGFASGSGYLARIHFTVLGSAGTHSAVHLANVKLFDIGANSRPLATIDGEVVVENAKTFLAGDINGDGVINISDVNILYRIILGLDPATPDADANGDSVIDMGDATKIQRIILGLP